MNFLAKGCVDRNSSGILYVPKIITVFILGLFFVFASVSDGSPVPGHITGDVTVFQKKFFGKLKKKKDMSGVFVYITGFKSETPEEVLDIVQEDRKFYPDILPVVVGQKVRFPNHDHIYHNVFSISPTKVFDLGQYKGSESPKFVTFDKPGLVPVFCNIHPQMLTYVIVLENDAIMEYNGTIDKFQGDSILAFWGAPIAQEDHALLACQTALKCRRFLHKLEEEWIAEGLPPRTYRFGINTGEVVVGNIGSSTRFEYTIIGDDVNLASRLEGTNKYYGTQIMISEATYSLVKDALIAREIDIIRVVGKTKSIKVYELVEEKEKVDEEKTRIIKRFETGIHAYLRRQWEEAISSFEYVLQLSPDDKPAKVYIQRCREYRQAAPAKDWNGVYTLSAK